MADINISELPVISLATNDDVFIINDANATTSQITWGELQQSIQNLTGSIIFEQGTAQEPSITFIGDLNNGIFSPGLDTIGFTTNGTERMRIDPAGNVGISSTGPSNYNSAANNLVVGNINSADNGITLVSSSVDATSIYFADGTGAGQEDVGQLVYDHSDNHMHFSTAASERMRINAVGNVGIGTSSIKSELHVRGGDSGITSVPSNQSGIIIESGATESGALQFYNAPGTNAFIKFGDSGSLDAGWLRYNHTTNAFTIQTLGAEKFHLTDVGDLSLGLAAPINSILEITKEATGGAVYSGVKVESEIQSDVTTDFRYFRSTASTQASTFNLTDLYHFSATQGTFGTSSTVDTQYGFAVDSGMTGGVTNYGFHSNLNQGTNTYSFYAAGTADNYFNGNTFTIANNGNVAVTVNGGLLQTQEGVLFTPGDTASRPTATAGLMRFNSDVASWEGYNGFSWGAIGGGATVTPSPPSNANEGDIWFDNEVGRSYIFYNDGDSVQWVEMNPSLNGGVANGSISTPQLADGAVTEPKILDGNVTTNKLGTNAVVTSKINNGAVTPEKLDREYLTDAPTDGNSYVRRSGAWAPSLAGASANSTFPTPVAIGQQHYNTNDGRLYIVIEDSIGNFIWVDASPDSENALVFSGVNPPNSPVPGNLWWDSESGRLFVYYVDDSGDSQWVEASPQVNGFTYDEGTDTWETGSNLSATAGTFSGNLEIGPNAQAGDNPFLAVGSGDRRGYLTIEGPSPDVGATAISVEVPGISTSFQLTHDGTTRIGGTPSNPNIKLNASGTANFVSPDTTSDDVIFTRGTRTLTEGQAVFLRVDGDSSVRQGSAILGVRWSNGADAPAGYINLPRYTNNAGRYYWTDSSQNLMSSSTANHIGTNSGVVIGTQTSDIRLKRNISDFDKGLAEVKQIEAMSFEYLSEPGVPQAGFMAQQVKDIIPEAVYDTNEPVDGDEDGPTMLAMDYSKIIPALVNAIKELDAKNTALEARLNTLEEGLN